MAQEGEPNQSMAQEGEPNLSMAHERTSPNPNPENMHMEGDSPAMTQESIDGHGVRIPNLDGPWEYPSFLLAQTSPNTAPPYGSSCPESRHVSPEPNSVRKYDMPTCLDHQISTASHQQLGQRSLPNLANLG